MGGIVWATLIGVGGYYLGDAIHRLKGPVAITTCVLATLVTIAFLVFVHRNEQRLEAEAERALPGPLYTSPSKERKDQAAHRLVPLQASLPEKTSSTQPAEHTQEISYERSKDRVEQEQDNDHEPEPVLKA